MALCGRQNPVAAAPAKDWDSNDMVELSFENLDQIEADVVFVTDALDLGDDLVAGVPAVAAGNAYSVDDRVWIAGIGVLGAERVIADVRGLLD